MPCHRPLKGDSAWARGGKLGVEQQSRMKGMTAMHRADVMKHQIPEDLISQCHGSQTSTSRSHATVRALGGEMRTWQQDNRGLHQPTSVEEATEGGSRLRAPRLTIPCSPVVWRPTLSPPSIAQAFTCACFACTNLVTESSFCFPSYDVSCVKEIRSRNPQGGWGILGWVFAAFACCSSGPLHLHDSSA